MSNEPEEQEPNKIDFPQIIEETDEGDDEQSEELSLDQLANAYAKVIHDRDSDSSSDDEADADDKDSLDDDEETTDDDSTLDNDIEDPERIVQAIAASRMPVAQENDLSQEDGQDNAGCPISPESILEAILFVGCPPDEKLTSRKIAAVMRDVSPKEVTSLYKVLNKKYKSENAPYHIISESGNLRMVLLEDDKDLKRVREQFYGEVKQAKLGQGAIDVLAVVAYNQPITRENVEKIRLKPSGAHLNQMLRRELLRVETKDDAPKVKLFHTTDRFLELFNLENLDDLPQTSVVSDLEELSD